VANVCFRPIADLLALELASSRHFPAIVIVRNVAHPRRPQHATVEFDPAGVSNAEQPTVAIAATCLPGSFRAEQGFTLSVATLLLNPFRALELGLLGFVRRALFSGRCDCAVGSGIALAGKISRAANTLKVVPG
jgi:hypothetical protein